MQHIIQTEKGFIMGSSIDIVMSMKNANMFTAPQPKIEYMEGVAMRVKELYLKDIRHDCAAHFLADLDQAGLIDLKSMH